MGMVFINHPIYPICSTSGDPPVDNKMENANAPPLILASQSLVRTQLLRSAGVAFETRPAFVDEAVLIRDCEEKPPSEIALHLAKNKALAIGRHHGEAVVIGADQVLVCDGAILQKPVNLDEARKRLAVLSGRRHQLVTAVVLAKGERCLWRHAEIATLTMHELSPQEIIRYLDEEGVDVLQSVGAYRLEGPGIRLFAKLEGDYFSMLGLPLVPLLAALRQNFPDLFSGVAPK